MTPGGQLTPVLLPDELPPDPPPELVELPLPELLPDALPPELPLPEPPPEPLPPLPSFDAPHARTVANAQTRGAFASLPKFCTSALQASCGVQVSSPYAKTCTCPRPPFGRC